MRGMLGTVGKSYRRGYRHIGPARGSNGQRRRCCKMMGRIGGFGRSRKGGSEEEIGRSIGPWWPRERGVGERIGRRLVCC